MQHRKWSCPKCTNKHFTTGEMRVSGGFWSRIFDVQNKRYFSVSCQNCQYTEFYKGSSSTLGNVFDFFTG